jgi:hypothetical protein
VQIASAVISRVLRGPPGASKATIAGSTNIATGCLTLNAEPEKDAGREGGAA